MAGMAEISGCDGVTDRIAFVFCEREKSSRGGAGSSPSTIRLRQGYGGRSPSPAKAREDELLGGGDFLLRGGRDCGAFVDEVAQAEEVVEDAF